MAGAGYAPAAPGTVGSAVTLALLWLIPFSTIGLAIFFLVVTAVGLWASARAERIVGRKDPSCVVIDEVAGMTLSVLGLPLTPGVLVSAFILFRVFDIAKPFPAHRSQRLPGGFGIMVDDLIAGAYTLALLATTRALAGVPA